jgi:hypothetical protein
VALEYRDSQDTLLKKVEYDYDLWNRRIAKRVDADGDEVFDEAFAYVYDYSGKRDPSTDVPLDDIVLVFDDSGSLISRLVRLFAPACSTAITVARPDSGASTARSTALASTRPWLPKRSCPPRPANCRLPKATSTGP